MATQSSGHGTRRRWLGAWRLGGAAMCALAAASAWAAEPYVPRNNDEVLEMLPVALFSSRDEVAELRERLTQNPTDPAVACAVAARYMQLGGQTGDARFYGYARAALGTWWASEHVPPDILRLRAKLKEKNHDYDQALADLKLLLAREPRDVQAWIETSNIYRVQGKYEEARRACDALDKFAGPFAAALARIPVMAVTGQAQEAYDLLAELMPEAQRDYPTTTQWFLTLQAEVALALGRDEEVEQWLRDGLRLAPEDKYLLRAYGEFLLDHGRDEEALALVDGHALDDGLLLCAAIAARRLGQQAEAAAREQQLESRFAEVRQRGDEPLGRFEALFVLLVKNDPRRALVLALANWQVQKETHDTQAVLEAAIAARDVARAQPALAFLKANRTQHAALQRLVAQLERLR